MGTDVCVFGGQEVSLSVEFPCINEREMFEEKFKVLVSTEQDFWEGGEELVIVGSVGILVGVVVYWALR